MHYDVDALDEVVLALLHLTSFSDHGVTRSWKSHDWEVLARLYEQGLISDPKSKARSVVLSEEGVKKARSLFEKHFVNERSGR